MGAGLDAAQRPGSEVVDHAITWLDEDRDQPLRFRHPFAEAREALAQAFAPGQFRQSFLAAYAHRVGDRLRTAAEAPATDDLLPALASREVAVTDRMDRMVPQTTTTRLRGVSDEAGWTEGARAADRAQVGNRPGLSPRPGRRR